jgi:protein tyrosine phosphatase
MLKTTYQTIDLFAREGAETGAEVLDILRIENEFNELSDASPGAQNYSAACSGENMYKNRYRDVYPDEDSRVKLNALEADTDYINASFLDGEVPSSERAYILTQAPLPHTFSDFWQMVWEQQCSVVLMLTKFLESGRQKAEQYWPQDGESCSYRFIRVSVLSCEERGSITVRHMRLERVMSRPLAQTVEIDFERGLYDSAELSDGEPCSRDIYHVHYTGWPDFGVPESTADMLQLLQLTNELRVKLEAQGETHARKGPLVVHCSAGLGRAGTLAAIHISLDRWLHGLTIDVPRTVRKMRGFRANLIQTPQQYYFVYHTIHDALAKLAHE